MRQRAGELIATAFLTVTGLGTSAAAEAPWDRTVLPRPDQRFKGVARRTLEGSVPAFPSPVPAPEGAPNILLVLIDDAGFGNPSSFGGPRRRSTR